MLLNTVGTFKLIDIACGEKKKLIFKDHETILVLSQKLYTLLLS